jgi:hypothetical protein
MMEERIPRVGEFVLMLLPPREIEIEYVSREGGGFACLKGDPLTPIPFANFNPHLSVRIFGS